MWPALSKTILHLHGGAGMKKILNKKNTIFFSINYYFLKKINKVIVLSESLKSIYKDILPEKNLAIVENFSEDLFFSNLDSIEKKFTNNDKLKCLFLSNLLPGKGINELLDAYKLLDSDLQSNIILNIAGATEDKKITEKILEMEYLFPNFKYHNVVQGLTKKNLLEETHLFILPTYYEYEGQPISILEAYASGSAVATTNHSGIPDIFTGGENGYLIIGKSHESILQLFHLAYNDLHNGSLIRYAFYNYNIASRKYRMKDYVNRFFNLFKMYDFSPENRRVLK
jgi:glycosyltransferase involved in cell wall biosynthesis